MLGVHRLAGTLAWAAAPPPKLIGMYLLLAAVLGLGAGAIVWAARRYRRPRQEKLTPEEQLDRFRALREQGELSPEEFERIRAALDRGPPSGATSGAPAEPPGPPDAFRSSSSRAFGGEGSGVKGLTSPLTPDPSPPKARGEQEGP